MLVTQPSQQVPQGLEQDSLLGEGRRGVPSESRGVGGMDASFVAVCALVVSVGSVRSSLAQLSTILSGARRRVFNKG